MTPALSSLKADLLDMIELNDRAHVTRVTRLILDNLSEQGRKFLRLLADMGRDRKQGFPRGSSIMLSIHGGAPAITDICKQSERFRVLGAMGRKKAA